jgi:(S)-ureidoglycine aminohydrolase
MNHFGHTRTRITRNHAFIAPDGHVPARLPGWHNSQAIVLISPAMGAQFSMSLVLMDAGGTAEPPPSSHQRFLYLLKGQLALADEQQTYQLTPGGYAYCPADVPTTLCAAEASQLVLFEKRYVPLAGTAAPQEVMVGHESEMPAVAFMGDEDAQLKLLLPDVPAFDMAINLFTFQPGTTLPFVETHVMEHGMMMLEGGGIYRLDEEWYPIQTGDVLWMGPYCPQWFAALGKPQSTYLYYKNINRDPLSGAGG